MASTGSRFEADKAGIIPDTIPITAETDKPKKIFSRVRIISKSEKLLITAVRIKTSKSPKTPPIKHKKTDSNKN